MSEIEHQVRSFIEENFVFRSDCAELSDSDSMLDAGLIDSTGILELVAFLEEKFDIHMADADIVPANLDSINAIAAYVQAKKSTAAAA